MTGTPHPVGTSDEVIATTFSMGCAIDTMMDAPTGTIGHAETTALRSPGEPADGTIHNRSVHGAVGTEPIA